MIAYLPFDSFPRSVKCLSDHHLQQQIIDIRDIIYLTVRHRLVDIPEQFQLDRNDADQLWETNQRHPAVATWMQHNRSLAVLGEDSCKEWIARSYTDTMLPVFGRLLSEPFPIVYPSWLGRQDIHRSHQSALIQLDPDHYGHYQWSVKHSEIVWPTKFGDAQ